MGLPITLEFFEVYLGPPMTLLINLDYSGVHIRSLIGLKDTLHYSVCH